MIIAGMSNIKEVHGKRRLYVSVNLFFWSLAASLRVSVVVVRTRPRAIPLAMITVVIRISVTGAKAECVH